MAKETKDEAADILLAFGGKPKTGEEDEGDEDSDVGLVTAMEDFIAAVKSGDAEAAAEAFKSAKEIC